MIFIKKIKSILIGFGSGIVAVLLVIVASLLPSFGKNSEIKKEIKDTLKKSKKTKENVKKESEKSKEKVKEIKKESEELDNKADKINEELNELDKKDKKHKEQTDKLKDKTKDFFKDNINVFLIIILSVTLILSMNSIGIAEDNIDMEDIKNLKVDDIKEPDNLDEALEKYKKSVMLLVEWINKYEELEQIKNEYKSKAREYEKLYNEEKSNRKELENEISKLIDNVEELNKVIDTQDELLEKILKEQTGLDIYGGFNISPNLNSSSLSIGVIKSF